MAGRLARAQAGFQAAQLLTSRQSDLESGISELTPALTALGLCSLGVTGTSRYEALRSGDLSLIRDHALRSQIDALYLRVAQRDFLHVRDCELADRLQGLLAPLVRFEIPPLLRPVAMPGWTYEDMPAVVEVLDSESLLHDGVILALVATIGSHRQYLISRLAREMSEAGVVLHEIRSNLDD